MKPDAIVVGAGIVGAACADALATDGMVVELIDARFAAAGATSAAMGHLVVMDDSDAQFALTEYSRRLWTERAPQLPSDAEDEQAGTLWIASDEEELAHAKARREYFQERGVSAEMLSAAELSSVEPNLRPGLAGALFVPEDRVVYPPAAARWLVANAERNGAHLVTNSEVVEIGPGFVRTKDDRHVAPIVVNATGVAAGRLTRGLPIEPRKGHLVITDRYPGFCRHQLVELGYLKSAHSAGAESVAFNLQPRATGQVLIGSSREFVGNDASINRRIVGRMLRRAFEFVPSLARLSALRTWVGFRPSTPDNLPLIGPFGEKGGLWIAAGHEGLGITTALGTARILADMIAGRTPRINAAPFAPSRLIPGGADA